MPVGAPSLDLSKATKLKDIEFRLYTPGVGWINRTLQTAESKKLRQITIHSPMASISNVLDLPITEMARLEWQNLDHLLLQLWTTRSIRPVFTYGKRKGGNGSGMLVPGLLPELTSRGVIDKA